MTSAIVQQITTYRLFIIGFVFVNYASAFSTTGTSGSTIHTTTATNSILSNLGRPVVQQFTSSSSRQTPINTLLNTNTIRSKGSYLLQRSVTFVPNNDQTSTGPSTATTTNTNTVADPVLREFLNKEAAIQKQREKAEALIESYNIKIQQLQNEKQLYIARDQLPSSPNGGSFSETALRSVVKAFVWRLLAGSITFCTTYQFSGSLKQALQVVSADFFSKMITMFIGERIMNKNHSGRSVKGGDNASRSLIKALIWRIFAICNTLTMAIFISKDISIASKIASTDAVFKTSLMFFYERFWSNINWGKEYLIEFSI